MLSRLDDIIAGDCPAKPAVPQRHWSGLPRSDWNMIFVFSGNDKFSLRSFSFIEKLPFIQYPVLTTG